MSKHYHQSGKDVYKRQVNYYTKATPEKPFLSVSLQVGPVSRRPFRPGNSSRFSHGSRTGNPGKHFHRRNRHRCAGCIFATGRPARRTPIHSLSRAADHRRNPLPHADGTTGQTSETGEHGRNPGQPDRPCCHVAKRTLPGTASGRGTGPDRKHGSLDVLPPLQGDYPALSPAIPQAVAAAQSAEADSGREAVRFDSASGCRL